MNSPGWWNWLAIALWATGFFALQGQLAAATPLGAWTPDLGLLFTLAVLGRVQRDRIVHVALATAVARAATSIEPPVAILAAHMFLAAVAFTLRGVFEISSALPRSSIAGLSVLALGGWFELVHRVRDARAMPALFANEVHALAPTALIGPSLASALSTTLVAVIAGAWLASLPGVAPLWRRAPWRAAASLR